MIDFFNTKSLDKLIEMPEFIEAFHSKDFKITDFVHNDLYRHMNDAGLFDYDYIERGEPTKKGGTNKPSKTNLVFLFWLMIAMELKEFGFIKTKLHKVKAYLFEELDILENIKFDTDKESLLKVLESFDFENAKIKDELSKKISTGVFLNGIKDKSVSRLFLTIFKLFSTGRDISLYVDKTGTAMFVDEFELSKTDIKNLSYDSRIILPLKKYLLYFIGEYADADFLTRSNILTDKEVHILNEFKRNDIISFTVKFHKGRPNTYEVKTLRKTDVSARLSEVLLKGGFEDIVLKTKQGSIYYSEFTKKIKL